MLFEWDESKRASNLSKHDVDFAEAVQIFNKRTLSRVDDRKDYGEVRLISIGLVEAKCFVVVHTQRHETIRIISAWKGGQDEEEFYHASIDG